MEQHGSSVSPVSGIDAQSALELSKTRDIIDEFWSDFCGLVRVVEGDTEKFIRVSKPKLTYEFAKELTTGIYIEINRVTGRTNFGKEEINTYLLKQGETMSDLFASEGMRNLVSPRAWEITLELAKPDENAKPIKLPNGQEIRPNKWYTKYGIFWEYNTPFNIDMLNIIKKDYDLEEEAFGQAIIMRHLFWSVRIFIHGGLNKSQDKLTLDHEKVIHKESFFASGQSQEKTSESKMEFLKNKLQGMVKK